MNKSAAIFIGFCVKPTKKVAGCPKTDAVIDVCSVAACIYPPPDAWYQLYPRLNHAEYCNDERLALSAIPPGRERDFELFAYRIIPVEFARKQSPCERPVLSMMGKGGVEIASEPDLGSYEFLGYDAVSSQSAEHGVIDFECSPLSCNDCAGEHPVNEHCLISNLQDALTVAQNFADTDPEPGPYYLVEVLRKRAD